jgi:hypothetical protein
VDFGGTSVAAVAARPRRLAAVLAESAVRARAAGELADAPSAARSASDAGAADDGGSESGAAPSRSPSGPSVSFLWLPARDGLLASPFLLRAAA